MPQESRRLQAEVSGAAAPDAGVPWAWRPALDQFARLAEGTGDELVGAIDSNAELVLVVNRAPDPTTGFRVGSADWIALRDDAEAIVHSHPTGLAWPTVADLEAHARIDLPGVIVPRGGEPFVFAWRAGSPLTPDLERRPFRWGATDCYGLVRDALAQLGVAMLADVPREFGYWKGPNPADPFGELHAREGFEWLTIDTELELGDVLLFPAHRRGRVAAHAGVYMGGGRMLDHPSLGNAYAPSRLPRWSAVGRYLPFAIGIARRA